MANVDGTQIFEEGFMSDKKTAIVTGAELASKALTQADLRGKVVLVDFRTYYEWRYWHDLQCREELIMEIRPHISVVDDESVRES